MLLREFWKNLGPEDSWLFHIDVASFELVSVSSSCNLELLYSSSFIFNRSIEAVRFIVGSIALISVDNSWTISLIVVDAIDWAIDWNLVEVDAKSVSLGVWVGE
jgi:hypothetical protein